jgi:hypothetical protein
VKYELEARVPKCGEVCGVFAIDVSQFIKDWVKERIGKLTRWDLDDVA